MLDAVPLSVFYLKSSVFNFKRLVHLAEAYLSYQRQQVSTWCLYLLPSSVYQSCISWLYGENIYCNQTLSVPKCHVMLLTGKTREWEHPRLLCNMLPAARGAQSFQTFSEALSRSLQSLHHHLNGFTPVENQVKYLVWRFHSVVDKDYSSVCYDSVFIGNQLRRFGRG